MTMPPKSGKTDRAYVLVTAAHNEEAFIGGVLESVVSQILPPLKWVIVSDGSTDHTDEIVSNYARQHNFIELLRIDGRHERDFAAKANALGAGCRHLQDLSYDFIGILDADVSMDANYYGALIEELESDPRLGLVGGFIYELRNGNFESRRTNRTASVPGAIQFFRRHCYEEVEGIPTLKYGGEDWCAEVRARMKGWLVEAFPELPVFHHRPTGTADRLVRHWFRQGRMDFSLGSDPTFEVIKCLKRLSERPLIIGALARLAGFVWSVGRSEERLVPADFVQFLRREQTQRLKSLFSHLDGHAAVVD